MISEQLLEKYNVPVPRYTSYPPANHFTGEFGERDYVKLLRDSDKGTPRSIALYIHIPFCKKICHYCGCNACPTGRGDQVKPYIEALKKEISMAASCIDRSRPVTQIHYGGGTPNSLLSFDLAELNAFLLSTFNVIDEAEIAIECNPAYLDLKYLDDLVAARFNRFSLGIQDFNNAVLKTSNREPSALPVEELAAFLREKQNRIGVNLDFIYGLPGQTVGSFLDTMRRAAAIRPDRLVTFSYAHVPWLKRHQAILEKAGLPSPQLKMEMFMASYNFLKEEGYHPLGLDHFVLPGDDLYEAMIDHSLHRNFQGYCTRRTTGQVYAFGVTAISQLEQGFSQNIKDVRDYTQIVNAGSLPVERGYRLSRQEKVSASVIEELMCNKRLNYEAIAQANEITAKELKEIIRIDPISLDGFEADGLLLQKNGGLEVTEKGAFFIRNIAASFDRQYSGQAQAYSRNV